MRKMELNCPVCGKKAYLYPVIDQVKGLMYVCAECKTKIENKGKKKK